MVKKTPLIDHNIQLTGFNEYPILLEIFNASKEDGLCDNLDIPAYRQAFEYHNPIRRAFYMAFKNKKFGEKPNQQALQKAWTMTKNFHDQGYKIIRKDTQVIRKLYSPWKQWSP